VNAISDSAVLMVAAGRIGFSDLASIYTIRTWVFGWFARLVTQVIFYTLFGFLLGSAALAHYRAIGNSAALVSIEGMAVVIAVTRERGEGTLALQLLAPYPYAFALTYLARGICNLVVGIGSSTAAFIVAAFLFRFPVAFPEVLLTPLFMAVMALASYCYGLALGAAVMAHPTLQWLIINVGYLSVMTFAGVNVPVDYWSPAIRGIASVLPLTHGLAAFRLLLNGGSPASMAIGLGAELAVAAGWLACALCLLSFAVWNGRRRGTLELSPS
jgi:ABC-2 type transport system permease protein